MLDKEAMIGRWRRAQGYEPVRTDCLMARADGPDIDGILEREMRSWYVKMLLDAPLSVLPLTDVARQAETIIASKEGMVVATLPETCVRVARVEMEGWEREAMIVTDPHCRLARAQDNPFARAGLAKPVAVVSGSKLTVYSRGSEMLRLTKVDAVMMPPVEGPYPVTDALLALMGPIDVNDLNSLLKDGSQ